MKIAILVWDLNITGGTQRQALELALALKNNGNEVDVFCYLYDKENCYKDLCEKLPVFSVKTQTKKTLSLSKKRKESFLYRFLKRKYGLFNMYKNAVIEIFFPNKKMLEMKALIEKHHPIRYYDVINLHDYEVYKIARVIDHPRIVWMMNDIKRYPLKTGNFVHKTLFNFLQRILGKRETQKISHIAVLDKRNESLVQETFGRKATVVRSGIDLLMFEGITRGQKCANNTWTIFASSIFFPYRRFEDLVDAIEILVKKNIRNLSVTINGIPDRSYNYYLSIQNRIKEKGLEPYISITTGMSEEDLKKKYRHSDIFVFPNHNQTWGLVVFEAMLAGCAVVVSRTCGAHEMLTDKENAILVNPFSPNEIAGALENLIQQPDELKQISEKGKDFVENRLSWKKYAEQMMDIFQDGQEKNTDRPLISVIIPTYNDGALLPIALKSIINQTYKNLEIIVVDDNSTDGTEKTVRKFAQKDPRVRYFKTPDKDTRRVDWRGVNINAGCFARNYGMKKATGEWIAFQDGDDSSFLNRIETQLKLAIKYNATCITTACVKLKDGWIGSQLDTEKFLEKEKDLIVFPQEIVATGKRTKGILINKWIPYSYFPFTVKKWFPFARRSFFGTQEGYPGAGNSPFFKREVFEKVSYRKLSDRVWLSLSGRGADRDFLFQVAETFQNSYSFRIPLYFWRVGGDYNPIPNWEKYIKK